MEPPIIISVLFWTFLGLCFVGMIVLLLLMFALVVKGILSCFQPWTVEK